jgi:hypothetical protein
MAGIADNAQSKEPPERHPNDGPSHEGSRSDAGGSYGDFSRPDKSEKFNTKDGGGSVAVTPPVVDVVETFGAEGEKPSDDSKS